MKLETYLPVFKGFYGSILEYLEDHEEASELFVDAINKEIESDFDMKYKFQKLQRPKFYNFKNDEIHVELTINKKDIDTLRELCINRFKIEFQDYLKEIFTSHEGFYSFYSNDINDWDKYIEHIQAKTEQEKSVMITTLIDFYLIVICEYNEVDLLEYSNQNGVLTEEY